jgi:hypothetical protein
VTARGSVRSNLQPQQCRRIDRLMEERGRMSSFKVQQIRRPALEVGRSNQ